MSGRLTHPLDLRKSDQWPQYLIRKVYWGESKGIFNVSAQPSSPLVTHTNHCFDYLLQSIKCSADMTLEWKTNEIGNFIGWDVPHTCKSWVSNSKPWWKIQRLLRILQEGVLAFMTTYRYADAEKAIDHYDHDD